MCDNPGEPANSEVAKEVPLLDNYLHEPGLIEPSAIVNDILPSRVVLCFLADQLQCRFGDTKSIATTHLEWEGVVSPVWVADDGRGETAFVHPGVDAPLAVGMFEELVAMGGRNFVACGSAGNLLRGQSIGKMVVATGAVRDDGTSLHYLPPSRIVEADQRAVDVAVNVLTAAGIDHVAGLTWTTDAPFRETPGRIAQRRSEGCLIVEMEAAALLAAARWRGVSLGYILYVADDVSGEQWDHQNLRSSPIRSRLLDISLDVVLELGKNSFGGGPSDGSEGW